MISRLQSKIQFNLPRYGRFTDVERVAVLLRVKDNHSGTQNAKIKIEHLRLVWKDSGVWLIGLSVLMLSVPTSIPNFASILLTTFGYTPQQAVCYAALLRNFT